MKTAATYARYSSDLQSDKSIEDQQALIAKYAAQNGYEIVATYADRARSGASLLGRDGIHALLTDAKAGKFEAILVEALDRISRRQADLADIYDQLTFLGVAVITLHEGKADPVHIGVRGIVGSLFLTDLAQKTWRGIAGSIAAGKTVNTTSYGYRRANGEVEIDPAKAEIVRRIFAEYTSGTSVLEIAKGLNRDGIPAPKGAIWYANTISDGSREGRGIVGNPIYRGQAVWNKRKNLRNPSTGKYAVRKNPQSEWIVAERPHLRIIDDRTWEAARARSEGRKRPRGRPMGSEKGPSCPDSSCAVSAATE